MKIPKEIAEKVAKYSELKKTVDALFNELYEFFDDLDDRGYYGHFRIADEPKGLAQGDGEYCDRDRYNYCEGCDEGTYYYPIDGSDKYVAVDYSF